MLLSQVREIVSVLQEDVSSYISVFAGRVADTGCDPIPLMQESLKILQEKNLIGQIKFNLPVMILALIFSFRSSFQASPANSSNLSE